MQGKPGSRVVGSALIWEDRMLLPGSTGVLRVILSMGVLPRAPPKSSYAAAVFSAVGKYCGREVDKLRGFLEAL